MAPVCSLSLSIRYTHMQLLVYIYLHMYICTVLISVYIVYVHVHLFLSLSVSLAISPWAEVMGSHFSQASVLVKLGLSPGGQLKTRQHIKQQVKSKTSYLPKSETSQRQANPTDTPHEVDLE